MTACAASVGIGVFFDSPRYRCFLDENHDGPHMAHADTNDCWRLALIVWGEP